MDEQRADLIFHYMCAIRHQLVIIWILDIDQAISISYFNDMVNDMGHE